METEGREVTSQPTTCILAVLRNGICEHSCRVRDARSGCACAVAADEIERLRAALNDIRDCVGGDDPSNGMGAPEDVWGIATEALEHGR